MAGCAAWMTVSVCVAVPAVNVIEPLRAAPLFAETVTLGTAPPVPVAGSIVNQDWFDVADQDSWFVDTATVRDCTVESGLHELAVAHMKGAETTLAAWVTVNVAVAVPAVNVITPVRAAPLSFGGTETAVEVPLTPQRELTANQDWFDVADQNSWLVDTDTFLVTDPELNELNSNRSGVTVTAGGGAGAGAWVTDNVSVAVPAAKVTTPLRATFPSFAVTVTTLTSPLASVVWPTVSQG